ncbi:MAG: winged helix-turn-helix transcriptional regulator [Archangium sp.]|nr:winged helix-turn-helix transcriptional regulator [Archangium sp.]
MLQQSKLDSLFHALSDGTRRAMVERLITGPASVSELAEPFDVSLSAIVQHLQLLEECGLVKTAKEGRVRTVNLQPGALAAAEKWFQQHRERWERRLDRLGDLLDEEDEKETKPRRKS